MPQLVEIFPQGRQGHVNQYHGCFDMHGIDLVIWNISVSEQEMWTVSFQFSLKYYS